MKRIFFLLLFPFACQAQIQGHLQSYVAGTTTLTDAQSYGRGVWTSGTTGVATIGSLTGIVTGVARGTTKIKYTYAGVYDSVNVYISTSDSSGYYFETLLTYGRLQQRDCDGATILNAWAGAKSTLNRMTTATYNGPQNAFQILWPGVQITVGQIYQLTLPTAKIKDFSGTAPYSTKDSILYQIQNSGF